jgi:hypothetical protein
LHIYNASWRAAGFTPAGEIEHMSASMRHLVAPELTTVAEVDGRPVAASFGLWTITRASIDWSVTPWFIRLLTPEMIKRIRLISTNVMPIPTRGLWSSWHDWFPTPALGDRRAEFSWVLERIICRSVPKAAERS